MNKYKLTRFIDKYHLGGNVNAVVINSKGDSLSTRFITGDKALLGELKMNNWTFEDSELGVYDTEQLSRLLGVLDDDVTLNLTQAGDKAIAVEISDALSKVNFMLSDKSVINQPPPLKQLPEFQVEIKVDSNFINRFISGKSALPDTDTFTVITDDDGVKLVIGYSSINTNRVTIPVETTASSNIDNVSFNANLFKDVLTANKECESATLYVAQDGLSKINFKVDDYDATYFLVAVQDVD
tara:strand:+ start:211 stop:930 length:720 start_codon:yes stop_codon:yes gene_type:complete